MSWGGEGGGGIGPVAPQGPEGGVGEVGLAFVVDDDPVAGGTVGVPGDGFGLGRPGREAQGQVAADKGDGISTGPAVGTGHVAPVGVGRGRWSPRCRRLPRRRSR